MSKNTRVKEEPLEPQVPDELVTSEASVTVDPAVFPCDMCEIRFNKPSTLHAHRQQYCTKRETTQQHLAGYKCHFSIIDKQREMFLFCVDSTETNLKRKSSHDVDASSLPKSRAPCVSRGSYCEQRDTAFPKKEHWMQHKLFVCRANSSLHPAKSQTRTGQLIYVPIPMVSSCVDPSRQELRPLDLSQRKKAKAKSDETRRSVHFSLDSLTEPETTLRPQQHHACDYCSIRFSSLKTLRAHQENYCVEFRRAQLIQRVIDKDGRESANRMNHRRLSSASSSFTWKRRSIDRYDAYGGHPSHHAFYRQPCSNADRQMQLAASSSLLQCTICLAMFEQEETLLKHVKNVHIDEDAIECLGCQSRFCSKWNLIRHMKLSHTNIKSDDDGHERPTVELAMMAKRRRTHDETESWSHHSENLIHPWMIQAIRLNHSRRLSTEASMRKRYSCPYCSTGFASIDTLIQHITQYCSSQLTLNEASNQNRARPSDTYCSSCDISFEHRNSFDAHKTYYCRAQE